MGIAKGSSWVMAWLGESPSGSQIVSRIRVLVGVISQVSGVNLGRGFFRLSGVENP